MRQHSSISADIFKIWHFFCYRFWRIIRKFTVIISTESPGKWILTELMISSKTMFGREVTLHS